MQSLGCLIFARHCLTPDCKHRALINHFIRKIYIDAKNILYVFLPAPYTYLKIIELITPIYGFRKMNRISTYTRLNCDDYNIEIHVIMI